MTPDGEDLGAPPTAPRVRAGRVAVIVPFRPPAGLDRHAWAERMLSRRLPPRREGDAETAVWALEGRRPREIEELSPPFRDAIGAQEAGVPESPGSVWLRLSDALRSRYPRLDLVTATRGVGRVYSLDVEGVEVQLLTADTGVVVIEVALPKDATLEEAKETLFFLRHLLREGRSKGIRFLGAPRGGARPVSEAYVRAFGSVVAPALPDTAPAEGDPGVTSLGAFVNWLLLLPGEDPDRVDVREAEERGGRDAALPPECAKVGPTRYARHHTILLLDGEPPRDLLDATLWSIVHSASGDYTVPPREAWTFQVLRPRGNRVVAASRTGVVAMSWIRPGEEGTFEAETWPSRFQGVYRCLAFHVMGEHASLVSRTDELASFGPRLARHAPATDVEALRRDLDDVVRRTTGQLLVLTGEDCGGITDYGDFFAAVRRAYSLDALVEGIRADLDDVAEVVHGLHEQTERRRERVLDERRRRASNFLAWGVAAVVPFGVAQGLAALFPDVFRREILPWYAGLAVLVGLYALAFVAVARFRRGWKEAGEPADE